MGSGQSATISLRAAADPLLAGLPLPCRAEFYPYGFPVIVASNSPAVLQAAEYNWAGMRKRFDEPPLEIRCLVGHGSSREHPGAPVFRAQRNLMTAIADAENFCTSDLVKGFAFAWVTEATAADTSYLAYEFIGSMAYSMLDALRIVCIHAACVTLDGQGVLLAGPSGAGKSTLAYACARHGWVYSSDDCSALVRRGGGRTVVCNSRVFRFRNTVGAFFPEFRGLQESRRHNGKPSIEVGTASLPGIRTSPESRIEHVVFLDRHGVRTDTVRLLPVHKEEALDRLFTEIWPMELPATRERRAAVERLLDAKFCQMRYRDLDSAVARLEKLVRGGV